MVNGNDKALRTDTRSDGAMKIIAVTNIKGGVGKTTTAVNLSYLCAAAGVATLLWDLDPQAAATYILKGEPREQVSVKKLISGKRELPELILPTDYPGLDLPARGSLIPQFRRSPERTQTADRTTAQDESITSSSVFDAVFGLPPRHFAVI